MPTDDRDQHFGRALARHLPDASPDSACPDAELLAAYHEGTLSLDEMSSWKNHIAGCARCQEILALVEQSETVPGEKFLHQDQLQPAREKPAPHLASVVRTGLQRNDENFPGAATVANPPAHRILRPRADWRWLAPLGAIAAAAMISLGIYELKLQRSVQRDDAEMAQNRPLVPSPPFAQSEPLSPDKKEEVPAQKVAGAPRAQKPSAPAPSLANSQKTKVASPMLAPAPNSNERIRERGKDYSSVAQSSAPAPSASGALVTNTPKESARPADAVGGAIPAARKDEKQVESAKPRPPNSNQTVQVQAATSELDATSQFSAKKRDTVTLLKLASNDSHIIIAPGEKRAWMLGNSGKINHSTDRGNTWQPQNSGVTADLTAGSATSDQVCWVIGKAGTLLRTTDGGKHWQRLSSPIPGDLGGIHATDDLHVSIWDVPNRNSFETSDGGATWTRIANE